MRKYLLPREGKFYKANMHMHTTVSDGRFTPAEAKERYMKEGYSIIAFTDHEVMIPHPELRDESFLPITSYELSIVNDTPWPLSKCYHLNLYAPVIERDLTKTFSEVHAWGNSRDHISEEQRAISMPKRTYTKEYAQMVINMANEEGCLVSYNHPVWSLQNYSDYSGLKGLWGVEWHNTDCRAMETTDTVQPLRDLWAEGELVYPLATDDCHSERDVAGGWIQVKAKSLDYDTVFRALKRGAFYSSNGPAIKSLYVEDGFIHIRTSAAAKISVISNYRWTGCAVANGKPLTSATIDVRKFFEILEKAPKSHTPFLRIEVIDKSGNRALTRPYKIKELK